MIYTALTKKAMKISFEAHKDQVDKCGIPYVYHPFHVAEQMADEITTCVALLHDVIEDTNTTIDDLKNDGFPDEVLDALELLTHKDNESYFDYVNRIKDNPIAKTVKLADLAHNMDLSRFDDPGAKEYARKRKYERAVMLLKGWTSINSIKTIEGQIVPCCGVKIPMYYKYCSYCGKELSNTQNTTMFWDFEFTMQMCPKCQKDIPMEEMYCGYCGTKTWR